MLDNSDKPNDTSDLDMGNVRATGVGLREGEIKALDEIGETYGNSRNALLRYAAGSTYPARLLATCERAHYVEMG